MKIENFIKKWLTIIVDDPVINIPVNTDIIPDYHITTTGSSTNIERCYTWSYNDRCLYKGDVLVGIKTNGLILTNYSYKDYLQKPIEELDIITYTFTNNITDSEDCITRAIRRFCECANHAEIIDEVIINFIRTLNIHFEDKYLNHCRKLTLEQFYAAAAKHVSRKSHITPKFVLNGLWYDSAINVACSAAH